MPLFLFSQSFSAKKRNSTYLQYKVTKPDLQDNLNKPLFDALEGIVWERDQNVVAMDNVKKYYGTDNQIIIQIQCLKS